MVTIKDVARESGLSLGTVSNVLNGKAGVKAENREKVYKAMKNGYTIFLCNGDRNINKERKYVNALLSKGIDGLIIVKPRLTLRELKKLNEYILLVVEDYDKDEESDFLGVSANEYVGVIQGMNLLYNMAINVSRLSAG